MLGKDNGPGNYADWMDGYVYDDDYDVMIDSRRRPYAWEEHEEWAFI